MAKMSDNLIGYGAAQVFDVSSTVRGYKEALVKKEKRAKVADDKFMKSLSVDTNGIRAVDVPKFTEKYNEFLDWAANNQVDLKNPSGNPKVFMEFQQYKQGLLQDIAQSKATAQRIVNDTKTLSSKPDDFYTLNNIESINTLNETSIYDDNFNNSSNYMLARDYNSALMSINTENLVKEVESQKGEVRTKNDVLQSKALKVTANNFFNQYEMELTNQYGSKEEALAFLEDNLSSRTILDYKQSIVGDGGGINIGFGGGSTGKVNYDVLNLSEQDAAAKYSDLDFTGAKEISFGFAKGENKPITFKDSKTGEVFEGVIPKAIILDPTTGSQGFVFYKPGKQMSESAIKEAFNSKKNELEARGDETLTDEQINAQAQEYVESLRNGAEFSASNVPIGEINVHYDNLYDKLKEGGLFKSTAKPQQTNNESEQKTDAFGNPIK